MVPLFGNFKQKFSSYNYGEWAQKTYN